MGHPFIFILLNAGVIQAEDFSKEVRTLDSYRVDNAPVIDGKLDDDVWKDAVKAGEFRSLGGKGRSKSKTEVMTCWDTDKLYIAFSCFEPKMELLAEHYPGYQGPFSWGAQTDELELFIQPFKDESAYFQFTASAAAELYHRFSAAPKTDKNYRWSIEVKTAKLKDRWQAEIAIPFTDLRYKSKGHHYGMTPSDGDRWRITFARFSVPVGEEWSSWNAGTFHRKGPLGQLIFKERKPNPRIQPDTAMASTVGKKLFRLKIDNPAPVAVRVDIKVEVEGTVSKKDVVLTPHGTKIESVPYQLTGHGEVPLSFIASVKGKVIKKGVILHRVEGTESKLKESLAMAKSFLNELPGDLDLQNFQKEAAGLVLKWQAATQQANALSTDEWHQLSMDSLNLLEKEEELFAGAAGLVSRKRLLSFWRGKVNGNLEYGAGVEDNMTKLRQEDTFDGQFTDQVNLSLARNEYEGAQIVLMPIGKDLKDVRVTVTDLAGPGDSRISADQIRVRQVGYVEVKEIAGIAGRPRKPAGMWPDPLMQLATIDCPKGKLQPIWIDVYASPSQPAGDYEGRIQIQPANSHPLNLSLNVRVWNFELPKRNSLKIDYWFWSGPGSIEHYYKTKFTLEDFKRYASFMGGYRLPLAPHSSHLWGADLFKIYREKDGRYTIDFTDYDPYLKVAVENGMNVFHLPYVVRRYKGHVVFYDRASGKRISEKPTEEESKKMSTAMTTQTWKHLKELEWFDESMTVYYKFDETQPRGKKFESMKRVHAEVKELAPGLRRTFAMNTLDVKAFRDHVDLFIPVIERIKPETIRQLQEDGFEVWWYTMGYAQWPDYVANQESVDHRIIMWMNWKYGVTGILRWALNRWGLFYTAKPWAETVVSKEPEKRWPNCLWKTTNSSSYLMYPGPTGDPWASIRMENHRDGVEDYEYFVLLKNLIGKLEGQSKNGKARKEIQSAKKLLAIPLKVIESRGDYTRDPKTIHEYRQRLGNAIDRLGRFAK